MLAASVFVASTAPIFAGPCTEEVQQMDRRITALLQAGARSGPSAAQSPAARPNRQPTPESIAAAESRLGTVPAHTDEAIKALVAAHEADGQGDQRACEEALAEVRRLLGP